MPHDTELYGLDRQLHENISEAERLVKTAQRKGGALDPKVKAQIQAHIEAAEQIKTDLQLVAEIDRMRGPINHPAENGGSDLGAAIIGAGFDLKHQPYADFPAWPIFGAKAATLPSANVIAPNDPSLVALGRDTRFLWPNLVRQDAGNATAIQDFTQTVRDVSGTVERAITATTDKAELNVTLTHVVEALKQFAVTISDIPNAILEATELMRQFFSQDGRFAVEQAIDTHVIAQIVAAAPPFGNTGTGLIEQVRNAVTAMRAEGANPSILVLNAGDAATLDLSVDAAGGFVFPVRDSGSSSPLWSLRVIERPGTTPPYVLDPQQLGVMYLGQVSVDADPYSAFKKNLTTLRVEVTGLFHVRDAKGARRIAAS